MAASESSSGIVFDVQRFSIHDGQGIRTTVFFKGCPLKCCWCQNPESHRRRPQMAFYRERCQACLHCAAVCPENAVTRRPEARIDFSRCTDCGACAAACRHGAIVTIGAPWPTDRLVAEILKDRDFFDDSGGGVTLSGGEPMQQHGYLAQLLPALKAEGLHVVLETSGVFPWAHMEPLLPYLDAVFFDLKHMDRRWHERLTGGDNTLVLANFSHLAKKCKGLQARMPLVSGMTDTVDNIRATARFLQKHRRTSIHCLPYHNMGEAKLPRIQTDLKPLGLARLTPARRQQVAETFAEEGIHAVIYD